MPMERDGHHTGNRIVKGLLGEMAGLIRRVQDLVVKDREVEGEPQTNGMSGSQILRGNLGGSLVCLKRLVGRRLALVTLSELGEVAVVVTLPGGCESREPMLRRRWTYILW